MALTVAHTTTTAEANNPAFDVSADAWNGTGAHTLAGAASVAQGGTGLTSGTSGGIPYFSSSNAIASSGALTANALVLGGGAGATPYTGAGTSWNDTTHALSITAAGNAGAAALSVLPSSGASFTKIHDNGTVIIDADSGTGSFPLKLKYNGSDVVTFDYLGNIVITGSGASVNLGGGVVVVRPNAIDLFEVTAPAGTGNTARIFAVDNGAGKTQLKVIFGSGAAQLLATEP